MSRKEWTDKEVNYLETKAGITSIKQMASYLNRSYASVQCKLNRMGLRMRDASENITISDFCVAMNITRSTVEYWVRNLDLPTRKAGKYRMVNPKEFWKWAEANKRRIDWTRVERFALGIEPDWVDRLRLNGVRHKNTKSFWTKEEVATLKFMVKAHRYTYEDVIKALDRSHGSIRRKLYDLGIKDRPIPNKIKKYSNQDIKIILTLRQEGRSIQEIAERVGGNAHYITDRIHVWKEETE